MKKEFLFNIMLFTILISVVVLVMLDKSFAIGNSYTSINSFVSNAVVGDKIKIGMLNNGDVHLGDSGEGAGDSKNPANIYCVQHGAKSVNTKDYTADYKIEIRGNSAKVNGIDKGTNNINGKIAYILGADPSFYYGWGIYKSSTNQAHYPRQRILWSNWNDWMGKIGVEGWFDSANNVALNEKEKEFDNKASGNVSGNDNNDVQIVNNGDKLIMENQLIGPIIIDYKGGTISSIEVKDINGNTVQNGISYLNESNNSITYSDIKPNTPFYIESKSEANLKSLIISVNSSNTNSSNTIQNWNADVWLMSASDGNQRMIIANAWQDEQMSQTQSIEIEIVSTPFTLRVVKTTEDGSQNQNGVGFIINRQGSGYLKGQWSIMKENTNYEYREVEGGFSWVSNKEDATIFETASDSKGVGYFEISNLMQGTYYIGEVYNTNEGYENSIISNSDLIEYTISENGDSWISKKTTIKEVSNNNNLNSYANNLQVITLNIKSGKPLYELVVYDMKKVYKDLTVEKYGEQISENAKQEGVEFYLKKGDYYAEWDYNLNTENNMTYYNITFYKNYIETGNERHIFKTGKDGKFIIDNLDISDEYELIEIINPNSGYENISIKSATLNETNCTVGVFGENTVNNNIIKEIKLDQNIENNIIKVIDTNSRPATFNINITKTKQDEESYLSGAKFKIQVLDMNNSPIGWLKKTTFYKYDSEYHDSTTWFSTKGIRSNSDSVYALNKGRIIINNLSTDYKYKICEITPGTGGVALNLQDNGNNPMKVKINGNISNYSYCKEGNLEYIDCGIISYDQHGLNPMMLVTNRIKRRDPDYLYIQGRIWVDERYGKQEDINGYYDRNEGYDGKATVQLLDNNNSIKKTYRIRKNENGYFSIKTNIQVNTSDSDSSIVEKLKGYKLKFVINDVNYSLIERKKDEENGSKAVISSDGTCAYILFTEEDISTYISEFYNYDSDPVLQHMNVGLKILGHDNFQINQNIDTVEVKINDYTYTYKYGSIGNTTLTAAPTVSYKNSFAYTRAIYPSDIKYNNNDDESKELKVYVKYRIDIYNPNKPGTEPDGSKEVDYAEDYLKVTSLINNYDDNRYKLIGDENWKESSPGKAEYDGQPIKIVGKDTKPVYITFEVKNEALNKLFGLEDNESFEQNPTEAVATCFHYYWDCKETYVNGIPKLKVNRKKTDEKEISDEAYYLKLKLNTERIITGTVFKDNNTSSNGEVLGNGKYDTDEETIKDIKVELITEDGETAKTYSSDNSFNEKDAKTISGKDGEDGTFTIKGITPGKYKVKFTYGDETVKISDYKSTIIKDDCIKNAIKNNGSNEEWYKHTDSCENKILYNTATDVLEQREEYNKNKTSRNEIDAKTPLMSIGVENTKDVIATVTNEFEEGIRKELIQGINFGIIEIPEISLSFDKVVSNIQITNTQGNILVEGNPATQNIKYVSNLDELDHSMVKGSKYTKSEINEDELYGSKLKLTYSITVQNNSEVNYYEDNGSDYYGYYYMFGDSNNSKEVTITVTDVLDFIDPSIKYENISIDEDHEIEQEKASDNQVITEKIQDETTLKYDYVVKITKWKELYTTKHKNADDDEKYNKEQTQDTANLTVTKILSTNEKDLGVSNIAQVTKIQETPALIETVDTTDIYFNDPIYPNPTDEVYVVITPPTGADMMTIMFYIVTIAIAGIIITIGIIVIKKKVI